MRKLITQGELKHGCTYEVHEYALYIGHFLLTIWSSSYSPIEGKIFSSLADAKIFLINEYGASPDILEF